MSTLTIQLMQIIGSPLLQTQPASEIIESQELFDFAFKNNVEMLYLNRLEEAGKLDLLRELRDEFYERQNQTQKTICRLSSVLQDDNIPHAITKTLRPYPGTPNDIDALYLGPLDEYEQVAQYLVENQYRIVGPQEMQYELFDELYGDEFNKFKHGGRFYIDFYRELAADHMPYMDSSVLFHEIMDTYTDASERPVKILTDKAELVVLALHSIIMHRTVPLEVIYTYSYVLASMSSQDINDLWQFTRQNHAEPAMRSVLAIMLTLYKKSFNQVPQQLGELVELSGIRQAEATEFISEEMYMPHTALLSTFVISVFSKIRGKRARRGFMKELFHMLNPVFAVEVIYHMLSKKRIKKHSAHV